MSTSDDHRRHLHIVRPDYATQVASHLRRLSSHSILTYLLLVTQEHETLGTLSPFQRARVIRMVGRLMKEIDRAA